MSASVALTLGGIESADALVMTHGAEVPNSQGIGGGWPGSTVSQRFGKNRVDKGRLLEGTWQELGPKPGLMPMTNRDVFAVTWQGGGGFGDPIERDPDAVRLDIATGLVSADAAKSIYGVILRGTGPDLAATDQLRQSIRRQRVDKGPTTAAARTRG